MASIPVIFISIYIYYSCPQHVAGVFLPCLQLEDSLHRSLRLSMIMVLQSRSLKRSMTTEQQIINKKTTLLCMMINKVCVCQRTHVHVYVPTAWVNITVGSIPALHVNDTIDYRKSVT